MKKLWQFISVFLGIFGMSTQQAAALTGAKNLFELSATDIDGHERKLSEFAGKVVLVVNVASKCGFTSQYEGLEEIYKKYKDRGLEILAFPSNDFMGQEPGSNEDIKKFCTLNYDVSFPIFAKGPVTGEERQPVFQFITQEANSRLAGRVMWNFEKFLFDRQGKLVERYRSMTGPESASITSKIEELLK